MSYIQQSLGADEKLIAQARFHWWYSLKAWLALIFLFWVLGWGIYIFIAMMLRKRNTEIGVTTHRFIMKTGIFSLHTQEMAIHNIEGVKVDQGFWGRVFGFGHLRIEGTGVDAIELPTIADPVAFRAAIETAKGGNSH
jgi:uncharacterized membrane protein YdbT with pleckstrin-like domain